jgi:hypothetical protein
MGPLDTLQEDLKLRIAEAQAAKGRVDLHASTVQSASNRIQSIRAMLGDAGVVIGMGNVPRAVDDAAREEILYWLDCFREASPQLTDARTNLIIATRRVEQVEQQIRDALADTIRQRREAAKGAIP